MASQGGGQHRPEQVFHPPQPLGHRAGLVFAALTDTCALGNLLSRPPYNRGKHCDVRAVVREFTDPRATSSAGDAAA